MAQVLCVHGVGQQLKGEDSLASEWAPALRDGMRRSGCAGAELPSDEGIRCMFYGTCSARLVDGWALGPWLTAADATEFDQELLMAWWRGQRSPIHG